MEILDTFLKQGLSSEEARKRLIKDGFNELPKEKQKPLLSLIFDVMREPMFLLLLATASIYVVIGDLRDSMSLFGAVIMIIGITIYQKRKTENAIQALRELSNPQALVLRDGTFVSLPGRELVNGDVIHVKEGDRVPADSLVLSNTNLVVDESILTGESVPVTKKIWSGEGENVKNQPGGDTVPNIYSGTLVVGGTAEALVYATGKRTQLGSIGTSLQNISSEETLLNKEIRRIVRFFAVVGVSTCVLLVLVYGFYYNAWTKGILAGLTLSISLVPEEFPVVLTVFLTLGAWRIAKLKVLTRKPEVIETLGAATVLCSDKTGTITMNKMEVQKVFAGNFQTDIVNRKVPENCREVIRLAVLSSHKTLFDPMEKAIAEVSEDIDIQINDWQAVREYPLSAGLMSMAKVWDSPDNKDYLVAVKGAPEAIFQLCHFSQDQTSSLLKEVQAMAAVGLRVLGVAKTNFPKAELPVDQTGFAFEFIGLIGLADPIRELVPQSVKECYSAGIRVIMITGDYEATAKNIAGGIGIKNPGVVISGSEIEALSDAELAEKIKVANIFSRVVPHQKLRLVYALKAQGEIVAMTGDGVNDAPALKAAHIGIAMGQKGTDVAREASDIVLLNDDFSSIVASTRMGRRIFANLQKAVVYIIAIHIPIAGLSLIPVFGAGLPIVLFPVHVAFFELLTDPVLSIAFEAEKEEQNIMQKPPRKLNEPLISKRNFVLSLLQGFFVLACTLMVYFYLNSNNYSVEEIRTITFATMISANLGLVLTNRSWTRTMFSLDKEHLNKTLLYLLAGGALLLVAIFYIPAVRTIFHFAKMNFIQLAISSLIGLASVSWFEIYKAVFLAKK